MPELPEVETIRLALEPHLVGRRFERVAIDDRPIGGYTELWRLDREGRLAA